MDSQPISSIKTWSEKHKVGKFHGRRTRITGHFFKNSWGESGKYKGIWYMTKAFVAYKTMDFMVNKNAVPKDIRKKINL